jgi:hypothetical protein
MKSRKLRGLEAYLSSYGTSPAELHWGEGNWEYVWWYAKANEVFIMESSGVIL